MSTYPPATLNFLSSKRKWYVYVTVPPELREGQVQIRRSTGTADKREAQKRLHGIATAIYAELDSKKPNPKLDWLREAEKKFRPLKGQEVNWQALPDDKESLNSIVDVVRMKLEAIQALPSDRESAEAADTLLDKLEVLETVAPSSNLLFSTIAKHYLQDTSFGSVGLKVKTVKALGELISFLGDMAIETLSQKNLYDFEAHLHAQGKARSTISGRISKIQGMFNFAVRKGYVSNNIAHGLRLTHGDGVKSYHPFTKAELHQIFKLPLPPRERLFFSIAVTTGMRRDEIALLTWDNIREEDGITYFDLTTEGFKLKNQGSARKVPIHPVFLPLLPERGEGRLFNYYVGQDGKSANASRNASIWIRKVTEDKRKVFHSFRHTIKDLMRDVGVLKETSDYITGHSSGDVAGSYGQGPSLNTRYEAIAAVAHPWLAVHCT